MYAFMAVASQVASLSAVPVPPVTVFINIRCFCSGGSLSCRLNAT
ncbi:hypothetical protein XSR1_20255 [Xenorhabdus szentirmaii DSM 16338]|uniref:Uncharacterized protein n=1 Tax=Xenorhabdus szentirmaii DSM 16338 TaxID=1427518 RepID=W1IXW5_9GAMM|nr:hypothetical protein XSR1_20255 [Xenorhabdus szentirmaii DSM 16338]